jgi:hypothetical protein
MIVLGADAHKRSHTIAAVSATTGELVGERTVPVGARGFAALLGRARGLEGERVWAIEDCRHVSGSFERFLIGRGERVLRVTTRLMAASRRDVRDRGKSDTLTPSRLLGPRSGKAWMPFPRSWTVPSSICGCGLSTLAVALLLVEDADHAVPRSRRSPYASPVPDLVRATHVEQHSRADTPECRMRATGYVHLVHGRSSIGGVRLAAVDRSELGRTRQATRPGL